VTCARGPVLAAAVCVMLLAACAHRAEEPLSPSLEMAEEDLPPEAGTLLAISDPLEPLNRAIYRFNFEFDYYIYLPIVDAYRVVVPSPLRRGIRNFFSNLREISTATNAVLQLRPDLATRTVFRFLVNSTIGVAGLFDVATGLGAPRQVEDLGQTLGWWGAPAGPFVVLPILGPSSVRDAGGLAGDFAASLYLPPGSQITEIVYDHPSVWGLTAVDQRDRIPFRYFASDSPFEYEIVRFLYLEQRELLIAQ
jgi:phospholipid-binding lipoprotein MlaA